MASWSIYRDAVLGEEGEEAIGLADIFSRLEPDLSIGAEAPATLEQGPVAIGQYRASSVNNYLQCFSCDMRITDGMVMKEIMPPSLCISTVFKGRWASEAQGRQLHLKADMPIAMGYSEPMEVISQCDAGTHVRMAALLIDERFFEQDEVMRDPSFRALNALRRDGAYLHEFASCQALQLIMRRLYSNPYHGVMARLNRESLALAAIVELASHVGGVQTCPVVKHGQKEIAYEARQRLDEELANPPSVAELAAALGVGETTLRRLFKQVIGISILDYLRNRRLELARMLLRQQKGQIAQIAYRVGYSDPANFSNAYRAYFGHSPRQERCSPG